MEVAQHTDQEQMALLLQYFNLHNLLTHIMNLDGEKLSEPGKPVVNVVQNTDNYEKISKII